MSKSVKYYDQVKEATKYMKKPKKGKLKLKAESKAKTKVLRNSCTHHYYNKNGKLRTAIVNNGNGLCICPMCNATFKADYYSNGEIKEIIDAVKEINNQAKYMAVAVGTNNKTVNYFANMGVELGRYKKNFKRLRNVAQQQNKVRDKKKKKKTSGGSAQYGSWKVNN